MAKATGVWTPTNCQVCGKEFERRDYIAITTERVDGAVLFLYCCTDCHHHNNKTKYEKRYYTKEEIERGDIR